MKILIVNTGIIPVKLYGGTERVIWCLGKELVKLGHHVTYLVKKGSTCNFASVLIIDEQKDIIDQIPNDIDLVHFNFNPAKINDLKKPYLITIHGNANNSNALNLNTVFVSKNHAERFGSQSYVHNGLDWDEYMQPDLLKERKYFHFLGNAAWRIKNVRGAIELINNTKCEKLWVLGGVRFNFNMGMRFTFSPRIKFCGMVGGEQKDRLLNGSKGLIFPVRWHEPFGLAIIESLFYGCPVFGTPYGSLPEIVNNDVGFLSYKKDEVLNAMLYNKYDARHCNDYAVEEFNSKKMALAYLAKYEKILAGEKLNKSAPVLKHIQETKFLPWE